MSERQPGAQLGVVKLYRDDVVAVYARHLAAALRHAERAAQLEIQPAAAEREAA